MPFVIAEPCVDVKDGACVDACPAECIEGGEDDSQLYIDPARCIDCDLCVLVCPVDAIYSERYLPERWQHYIEINAAHFRTGEATA